MTAFNELHECHARYEAMAHRSLDERFDLLKQPTALRFEKFETLTDLMALKDYDDGVDIYSEDGNYRVNWHSESLYVTELYDDPDADKRLRDILVEYEGDDMAAAIADLDAEFGTLDDFIERVKDENFDDFEIRVYEVEASKTFSPMAMANLPRLTKIPTTWSHRDVMRILANGQFSYFANLRKDRISDVLSELESLFEKGRFIDRMKFEASSRTAGLLRYTTRRLQVDLGLR
tara:strand:+ start:62932 stop:63630 length:699 start_codon:yes stop_codon:yes gene_type:complete